MAPDGAAPPVVTIASPDDPRVADFRRLNDGPYRRLVEAPGPFHHGFFVGEGWLVLERMVALGYGPRAVLVLDSKVGRAVGALGGRRVPVLAADAATLAAIVGFDLHRGVVAVADRRLAPDPEVVSRRAARLVVLEGINDGENLGAIYRNAAALGADGVLIDPTTCDPLARRTVRVSMGHVLGVPTARVGWPSGLRALAGSHTVVALSPGPGAVGIDDLHLDPDRPVAVLLGAEGPGLSEAALDAAAAVCRIPMRAGIDSLNVAAASAIAFHRLFAGALPH